MSYAGESAGIKDAETPRLLDRVGARLRLRRESLRVEPAQVGWSRPVHSGVRQAAPA